MTTSGNYYIFIAKISYLLFCNCMLKYITKYDSNIPLILFHFFYTTHNLQFSFSIISASKPQLTLIPLYPYTCLLCTDAKRSGFYNHTAFLPSGHKLPHANNFMDVDSVNISVSTIPVTHVPVTMVQLYTLLYGTHAYFLL